MDILGAGNENGYEPTHPQLSATLNSIADMVQNYFASIRSGALVAQTRFRLLSAIDPLATGIRNALRCTSSIWPGENHSAAVASYRLDVDVCWPCSDGRGDNRAKLVLFAPSARRIADAALPLNPILEMDRLTSADGSARVRSVRIEIMPPPVISAFRTISSSTLPSSPSPAVSPLPSPLPSLPSPLPSSPSPAISPWPSPLPSFHSPAVSPFRTASPSSLPPPSPASPFQLKPHFRNAYSPSLFGGDGEGQRRVTPDGHPHTIAALNSIADVVRMYFESARAESHPVLRASHPIAIRIREALHGLAGDDRNAAAALSRFDLNVFWTGRGRGSGSGSGSGSEVHKQLVLLAPLEPRMAEAVMPTRRFNPVLEMELLNSRGSVRIEIIIPLSSTLFNSPLFRDAYFGRAPAPIGFGEHPPLPTQPPLINEMPTIRIREQHVGDEEVCSICTDRFEVGAQVRRLPCNHLFHDQCLRPWLQHRNTRTCPLCRLALRRPYER